VGSDGERVGVPWSAFGWTGASGESELSRRVIRRQRFLRIHLSGAFIVNHCYSTNVEFSSMGRSTSGRLALLVLTIRVGVPVGVGIPGRPWVSSLVWLLKDATTRTVVTTNGVSPFPFGADDTAVQSSTSKRQSRHGAVLSICSRRCGAVLFGASLLANPDLSTSRLGSAKFSSRFGIFSDISFGIAVLRRSLRRRELGNARSVRSPENECDARPGFRRVRRPKQAELARRRVTPPYRTTLCVDPMVAAYLGSEFQTLGRVSPEFITWVRPTRVRPCLPVPLPGTLTCRSIFHAGAIFVPRQTLKMLAGLADELLLHRRVTTWIRRYNAYGDAKFGSRSTLVLVRSLGDRKTSARRTFRKVKSIHK